MPCFNAAIFARSRISVGETSGAKQTSARTDLCQSGLTVWGRLANVRSVCVFISYLELTVYRAFLSGSMYHQLIQFSMLEDPGISTLVELHDQIIDQGNGYWIKIEAWRVVATPNIPHGVRYSLTLHEPYGKRILGYDNAHAVKPPKKFKYAGTRLPYDHKHRHVSDKGVPYEFRDAHQLLADFFTEVDRVLEEIKRS